MTGKYIGEDVKTLLCFNPQVVSGSTVVYGPAIDRLGYESAVLSFITGALANSPTNVEYDIGLVESDTQAGTYAAVSGVSDELSGQAAAIPGQLIETNFDLRGRKRWIKATVTPTWTGGSSPTGIVGGVIVLGEATAVPI